MLIQATCILNASSASQLAGSLASRGNSSIQRTERRAFKSPRWNGVPMPRPYGSGPCEYVAPKLCPYFPFTFVPRIKNMNGMSPIKTSVSTQKLSIKASTAACCCTRPYSIACARTAASAIEKPC